MVAEIIEAYYVIGRSRQYVGTSGVPAPLGVGSISEYLSVYGSSIDRREFDAVIFALDDEFRESWAEKNKPKEKG